MCGTRKIVETISKKIRILFFFWLEDFQIGEKKQALDAGRVCFTTDKIVFPPSHPADFEREHELCASLDRAHSQIWSLW